MEYLGICTLFLCNPENQCLFSVYLLVSLCLLVVPNQSLCNVEPMFLVVNIHSSHSFLGKPAGHFQHFAQNKLN